MPDEAGYSADTNYRFVASIREDFLFVLEDSIDENSLDLYKNNRYRLRPMKPEQAREVVFEPGRDCIEESEKDKVADRIVTLARRNKQGDIDTLLLSLVCAGSFDKKTGEKITLSDLAVWKNNPMEVYYQDSIKGLSANQVRYIQQHLIRDDGSRRRVDAEEVKNAVGEVTYRQLTQGKNRLFAIGDKGQVELLHDQLGMAVFEERKKFEEKRQKIKKAFQGFVVVFGLFATITVLLLFNLLSSTKKERNEALKYQSRFLAEKAKIIAPENSRLACLLALEALPKDINHPDRPYTKEAEWALREAVSYHGMILEGNKEYVYSVCYSPSGNYVASGSEDGAVFVWDKLGIVVRKFKSANAVLSVSFSPNGKNLVASSWNKIEIWDVERDTLVTASEIVAGGWIRNVVYSPDGKSIFVACNDNTIKRLDSRGTVIGQLVGHTDQVSSIAFSPNGKQITTASFDHTIRIWDLESGQLIQTLEGHEDKVNDVCYSLDGKQLVSGSSDNHAMVWDMVKGTMIKDIEFDNSVLAVSYSYDGKYIAFASWNQIDIMDTEIFEIVNTITDGDENWIKDVEFNPNSNNLVYGSGAKVRLVGMDDAIGQHQYLNRRFLFNHPGVVSAAYNTSGDKILTASETHGVILWDGITGEELWEKETHIGGTTTASFSPDGNLLVYNEDSLAVLCDIFGNTMVTIKQNCRIDYVSFGLNGKETITLTKQDSTVRFWNIDNSICVDSVFGTSYDYIHHHKNELILYRYSSDEFHFELLIIPYNNWKNVFPNPVGKIAYNPTKEQFATIFKNQYVISEIPSYNYNDVAKFDYEYSILGTENDFVNFRINTIAYSPNGEYIIIATKDHKVRIANSSPETKGFLCTLNHNMAVQSASFSPDGKHIMSVQEDGTVMIWDFPPLQELIDQTRERFKYRPLTLEERKQYYLE